MFIDMHNHVCFSELSYTGGSERLVSPEQLLEMHRFAGIDMGVLLPCVNPECMHVIQSNEEVLKVVAEHPDHFVPFCNLDPRQLFRSPEANFTRLLEHYREKGCRGIGEVCANLPFGDPLMRNLFHHVEACGFPLTFHIATKSGGTYGIVDHRGLPGLEKALQDFPSLTFLGHSQAFWSHMSGDLSESEWGSYPKGAVTEGGRIPELMRRYPNLHGDLSAGSGHNAVSRDPDFGYSFLEEFQDRLYFATDVCMPGNRDNVLVLLKNFLESGLASGKITRGTFDKITHKNAQRLLALA